MESRQKGNSCLIRLLWLTSPTATGRRLAENMWGARGFARSSLHKLPLRKRPLRFLAPRQSNVAAALWARHCEHGLDRRVVLVATTGERAGAGGVESAADHKTLVDMESDHLAERENGAGQRAAQRFD